MHLLAVNYYVHRAFAEPVNPNGKVKSIANTRPFTLYFLGFSADRNIKSIWNTAQILRIRRAAFRIFYMAVVN